MTAWLLELLGRMRGSLGRQVALSLIVLVVGLPVALFVDALRAYLRASRIARALAAAQTRCPRGHVVELVGAWQCGCGYVWRGHAWESCPLEGTRAHYIYCACGCSVRSPIADLGGRQ